MMNKVKQDIKTRKLKDYWIQMNYNHWSQKVSTFYNQIGYGTILPNCFIDWTAHKQKKWMPK